MEKNESIKSTVQEKAEQPIMQILNDLSPKVKEIWESVRSFSGDNLGKGRDFAVTIPGRVRANPIPYVAIGVGLIAFGLLAKRGTFSSLLGRGEESLRDQAIH